MAPRFLATPGSGGIELAAHDPAAGWTLQTRLPDHDVRALATDPQRPGTVYAGTNRRGLWISRNRGADWEALGLDGEEIRSVAVSPLSGDLFVGIRPAGIYVSRDAGASWRALEGFQRIRGRRLWFSPAEPPWSAYVQAIAVSPTDPQVLLAGIEAGAVVRSEDGGATWSNHLRGSLRDCHSLLFHSSDGNWVYEAGGTGGGVAYSDDGGRSWSKRPDGLDRGYGWACAADPAKPEIWYASLAPGPGKAHGGGPAEAFVYRAVGGAPWEKLSIKGNGSLRSMPYGLVTHPQAPGELYVGLANGEMWRSNDHGDSWEQMPFQFSGIGRCLLMTGG